MKTPIKIIILIVVIFAAVGGVMVYMKTRVAPPDPLKLETKNNFLADSVTKACTNTTDLKAMPKERVVALDMLALLNSESLLAENDANKRISAIENHYADLVGKFSSDVFRGSVWEKCFDEIPGPINPDGLLGAGNTVGKQCKVARITHFLFDYLLIAGDTCPAAFDGPHGEVFDICFLVVCSSAVAAQFLLVSVQSGVQFAPGIGSALFVVIQVQIHSSLFSYRVFLPWAGPIKLPDDSECSHVQP